MAVPSMRCRPLEKAEAEQQLHQIWQCKREFQAAHEVSLTLADYMYVHMHRKHATPKAAVEVGGWGPACALTSARVSMRACA